ncbi:MAG: heme biosynthesis HemY N-terminal domain-containing protein [Pseudomonadota bacterium]
MKLVISAVVAIGLAIVLALLAMEDPGYVVLAREPYTVRLPLALFVLGLLVAFAILYLLFNFIAGVFRAPKKISQWNKRRNEQNAQVQTMKGYAGLIEGDWTRAEDHLLAKIEHNNAPLMNLLGAAYAAQQQGHLRRRDQYLDEAMEKHPKQATAVKLTQARLQYQSGQISESRDTLESVHRNSPKNVPAVRLLADVYQTLGDWPSMVALLPKLSKLKAFPEDELENRERTALEHHLATPALTQGNTGKVQDTWNTLPSSKRKDPKAVASYAKRLSRSGEGVAAEKLVRKALNRGWDSELANIYGKLETDFVKDQLKLVESWSKKYPEKTELILAKARLLRRGDQPEDAAQWFRQAIAAGAPEEATAELGDLLEAMGEKDAALDCYKQGLKSLCAPDGMTETVAPVSGELVVLEQQGDGMPVVSNS